MRTELIVNTKSLGGTSDLTLLASIRPGLVPSLESVTYKTRVKRLLKALNVGRSSSHEYNLLRPFCDAVERVGRIHSVRVTSDCTYGIVYEGPFLSGVDWVLKNHVKPAVANISIGFPKNANIDAAVKSLSDAGVYVAIAAGNSRADACNTSPAGGTVGTTVGATRSDDQIWVASTIDGTNVGPCVDVFAPGAAIQSTWIGSALLTISGTSMAAPHVAGAAALYKATYGDQPSTTVQSWIVNNAQPKVVNAPVGTTNKLLYKGTI